MHNPYRLNKAYKSDTWLCTQAKQPLNCTILVPFPTRPHLIGAYKKRPPERRPQSQTQTS